MSYTIFDITPLAILIDLGPDGKGLGFTLAEKAKVPEEFKIGDVVKVTNHPSHPAQVAMGNITGHYEIKHVASGTILKTWHKGDIYKVL